MQRFSRFLALLLGLSIMAGCATINEQVKAILPTQQESSEIETAEPEIRLVAEDKFKQSRMALSAQQQRMVGPIYQAVSKTATNSGQLDASIQALETYIASNAGSDIPSMLFLALGDGYTQLGQEANAMSAWQQSIRTNQLNYFAHNRLAQALRQQGDFDQARQHYNTALEAWPDFADAYRNRGILFDLYLGDKVLALKDYQQYHQLLERNGENTREVERWLREVQRAISE